MRGILLRDRHECEVIIVVVRCGMSPSTDTADVNTMDLDEICQQHSITAQKTTRTRYSRPQNFLGAPPLLTIGFLICYYS